MLPQNMNIMSKLFPTSESSRRSDAIVNKLNEALELALDVLEIVRSADSEGHQSLTDTVNRILKSMLGIMDNDTNLKSSSKNSEQNRNQSIISSLWNRLACCFEHIKWLSLANDNSIRATSAEAISVLAVVCDFVTSEHAVNVDVGRSIPASIVVQAMDILVRLSGDLHDEVRLAAVKELSNFVGLRHFPFDSLMNGLRKALPPSASERVGQVAIHIRMLDCLSDEYPEVQCLVARVS